MVAASRIFCWRAAVQSLQQRKKVLSLDLFAFIPALQDDISCPRTGKRGVVVERGHAADGDDPFDTGNRLRNLGDLFHDALGAFQRRSIGKLCADHEIALILKRQKRRWHAGNSPEGNADEDKSYHCHHPAAAYHHAYQARIDALGRAIDPVEDAEEKVALFGRHRWPQPEGRLRRLQGHRVYRANKRRRGNNEGKLAVYLPG